MGAAAPVLGALLGEALADAGVGAAPSVAVGVGTPDVSGLSVALEAPVKAGDPPDAEAPGVALVALGFKTLFNFSGCLGIRIHQPQKLTCQ